ncbi:H-NS family nucleoid-associated regulatory protein [Rhodoplanes sp. Z2-YC6860]|uniref:H-NS family nucleoid-associated regulatory protein n=1 Tax=Rhodoplanes sp. Z2-YC6860 TaxID=674703 RepID=UPI00078DF30B|nr:H-NS family nucleoid-associated regulatory protein [Rhodoplanes sp. Z2-YC6860]AMN44087.1 histone-like nucleoid-structuring protein H-NS [Rhodoplanes sp. Z2-YC6860]
MAKKAKRKTKAKSKNTSYASMTMDALFDLRNEITGAIESRASELRKQLARLTGDKPKRGPASKMAGRTVAPQFRSKKDSKLTWSGRGQEPRWMKEEMKGTKLKKEDFRIK